MCLLYKGPMPHAKVTSLKDEGAIAACPVFLKAETKEVYCDGLRNLLKIELQ